jgi:hypothetical protein
LNGKGTIKYPDGELIDVEFENGAIQ